MGELDSAFKMLVQLAPQDFVARFYPGAEYVRTLSIELPRDPLRADELLLIRFPHLNLECVSHFEEQSEADDTIPERMCQYAITAYLRDRWIILSTVIYLQRCKTPTPPFTMNGPNGNILTFHYQVVRLWEEPVEEWLNAGQPALLPFVPLLKGATVEVIAPAVQQIDAAIPSVLDRGNIINYLLFFASRAFDAAELTKYLEDHNMLTEKYIVESPWYQYILHQGEEQGRRQGEEIGRRQGEEIGRRQGEEIGQKQGETKGLREAVMTLAARRFPDIEREIETYIAAIDDPARLQEIVVLVGTAPDEATVRQGIADQPAE
jgi:predicted transposase YdaD